MSSRLVADGTLHELPISSLHLDHFNPRFGIQILGGADETKLLDEIIKQHGINDVVSSLAENGYFHSEPLVGAINRAHGPEVTIIEGNRRLTAAIILSGDKRGQGHQRYRSQYQNSKIRSDSLLPVMVYDWDNSEHRKILLPYLGVRHIIGGLQWDSFAKAAWVSRALGEGMTLTQIKRMIGDEQGFTDRLLEGYHFVLQVRDKGLYDGQRESQRRGRGSLTEFPFSWVYTSLGYRNVRQYLGLEDTITTRKDLVKDDRLKQASNLMQFMFGGTGRSAVISDSREIGALAKALGNTTSVALLERGVGIEEALEGLMPEDQLLQEKLQDCDISLGRAVDVASRITRLDAVVHDQVTGLVDRIDNRLETLNERLNKLRPRTRRKSRRGGQKGGPDAE